MRRIIVILILVYSGTLTKTQTNEKLNQYIERVIEQTVVSAEGDVSIESIVDDLENLYLNPLNINTATRQDFDKLWILTDFQVLSILEYRKQTRQIISLNELNYLYGFNAEIVNLIEPFISWIS